jgi:hypothetical protein
MEPVFGEREWLPRIAEQRAESVHCAPRQRRT